MLTNIGLQIDLDPLISDLDNVMWDNKNRCDLNEPTGHWLYDPYRIKEYWKGSQFEKLLCNLPLDIGEARLMKLTPGSSYRSHADVDDRYHLNLVSNEQCYLIDLENQEMHQLKTDGYFYHMNAGKIHTACNFGSNDRIQLVIRIPLKKYSGENFITKKIKFVKPVFNLRYILDNNISGLINRFIKNGDIGYFNPISETEIEFHIRISTLNDLIKKIKNVHEWIIIDD